MGPGNGALVGREGERGAPDGFVGTEVVERGDRRAGMSWSGGDGLACLWVVLAAGMDLKIVWVLFLFEGSPVNSPNSWPEPSAMCPLCVEDFLSFTASLEADLIQIARSRPGVYGTRCMRPRSAQGARQA